MEETKKIDLLKENNSSTKPTGLKCCFRCGNPIPPHQGNWNKIAIDLCGNKKWIVLCMDCQRKLINFLERSYPSAAADPDQATDNKQTRGDY